MKYLKLALFLGSCAAAVGCTALLGDFDVSNGPGPNGGDGGGGPDARSDGDATSDGSTGPSPGFERAPLSATGWVDVNGQALSLTVKAQAEAGTIYECRTAPIATFNADLTAWANCDGAGGDGRVHLPKEALAVPQGTYRTEHRYKVGAYTSPIASVQYYVHKSLDKVASCPRLGVAIDGPHFSDEQFFAAATDYAKAHAAAFPVDGKFPAPGEKPTDALYLGNPWIKIPFKGMHRTRAMGISEFGPYRDDDPWPADGKDYLFNERSLRHKWTMNGTRDLILVTRQYVHPKNNDCRNPIRIGGLTEPNYGPPGRGDRKIECEGYVLNSKGNAICLVPNDNKIEAVIVDRRIPTDDSVDGGKSLGATFSTFKENNYVASSVPSFTADMKGGFLQIPESIFGRWYEIDTVDPGGKYVYLKEPFQGGNTVNIAVRYTATVQTAQVIESGIAKLHQNGHSWATGKQKKLTGLPFPNDRAPINRPLPSHRTKCDEPGCDVGKPWLTYLPL